MSNSFISKIKRESVEEYRAYSFYFKKSIVVAYSVLPFTRYSLLLKTLDRISVRAILFSIKSLDTKAFTFKNAKRFF
jgi:hypothetical protein